MTTTDDHIETTEHFSEAIKAASWSVHEHAERSPFMRKLLAGEASIGTYAELVAQHYFAYQALEEAAVKMSSDPVAGEFAVPELIRLPSLERDLEALLGADWRNLITPNEGTKRYVERIREVCFTWPGAFIAHHYVRYLGDLSGGQIIRRILQRTYDVGDAGVSFYVFDKLDNGVQFKKHYRHLLDVAPWDATERQAVIDEVIIAFQLNSAVLDQLD